MPLLADRSPEIEIVDTENGALASLKGRMISIPLRQCATSLKAQKSGAAGGTRFSVLESRYTSDFAYLVPHLE